MDISVKDVSVYILFLHHFCVQVEPDCPDFATYYGGVEHAVKIKVLSISTLFDQASMMYLNAFIQGIVSRCVIITCALWGYVCFV